MTQAWTPGSAGDAAVPIAIKRVYERRARTDGYRVLIDRLWPRGLTRADAAIDLWLKEIAPSTPLRRWFGHDAARWREFRARYSRELEGREECLRSLVERARCHRVTLVYGSREQRFNHAAVLRDYLEKLFSLSRPRKGRAGDGS